MELIRPLRGRLSALVASAVLVSGLVVGLPATAEVKPGGFMSANVTWLGHIPLDAPGVGGRVVTVATPAGPQVRFFVTGAKGLTIYDVTNPTLPIPLGTVALPHFQNEDVSVSDDGDRVIISGERVSGGATVPGFGPTFVIDASDPRVPVIAKVLTVGSHTVTCVDADCDWIYSSSGEIYDLRDLSAPQSVLKGAAGWTAKVQAQGVVFQQGAHDLNVDAAGYVITDTVPRVMLDVADPLNPVVLTTSDEGHGANLAYQHNNLRPGADTWVPRNDSAAYVPGEALFDGEILLANGETNFEPECGPGSGPFSTWSTKNWDKGQPFTFIDVYRPLNGEWVDGNPAFNVVGCSGHWFTERDGVVATGWYEHGVRFLEVDDRGFISEVGFFQPVVTSASGAYWASDDIVYTVDYARGIDILRFDRDALVPDQAEIDASWQAGLGAAPTSAALAERFACQLAQRAA
ncbi:MAG TPA: Hsp20/alpha crystallin family protein [Acidimicrobiia bacterium]|nr:Hsp20/alpha crystallin family protein [Acidimicrobiia bacterium]